MSFIQPSMNSFNQINAQFSLTDLNMNSANNANNNNFKQVKTQNSIQSPTKRKNNKDPGNRTYICGCGKTYGSNAALYTHIKNKHGGYQPENTIKPSNTDQSGKRGRPLQNIKKEGQFKKANGFVELDNIQERKMKIIYDKDSNQIFALFLEFGEQEEQKNPFEVIVTQKKGEGFLLSGLGLDRIKNIEQTYLKKLDIDQEQQDQIKKNKPNTDEHIYKTLQRFSQIWIRNKQMKN
ncbi:hypothetical protein PPERSA_13004 [Pseudocohnilembus persalinus]|uniref:C2H2-type domain-containing protein n=1 Tax=Pseudocohnilembus persalinus TaxID=266149 RepID=A0A0V0R205_PSEPJ|nr:hypothetical protein PPERSA_13004 [Pseudocohnilembus persalinus]|eukprot:KRX08523.1 hypothetical protein PPERSA_13004 [Pseudocohnilembus persalinus]